MTKNQQLAEKVIVTFVEAALAYVAINQTNLSGNLKLTAIGALGAGLSAVYNLVRQAEPTITPNDNTNQFAKVANVSTASAITTPTPLNGAAKLAVPKPLPPIPPLDSK